MPEERQGDEIPAEGGIALGGFIPEPYLGIFIFLLTD
jgi:hypothetical protein